MFHLMVLGALDIQFLEGYSDSEYSDSIMGRWFLQYRTDVQIYLLYINHPVHPV